MKKHWALFGLPCLTAIACTTVAPSAEPDAGVLLGAWSVDLRSRPDAPPYMKELLVTGVKGTSFEGSFYDSPITEGRVNVSWGAVRIAFITSDGVGAYYHSAVLSNGRLEGLSNVPHRAFLAYWSAVKR